MHRYVYFSVQFPYNNRKSTIKYKMKKAESLIDILVRREDQSDPSTLSKRELAIRDLAAALEEDREKLSASKLLLLVKVHCFSDFLILM